MFDRTTWNHLPVYRRISSGSFKNASTKCVYKWYTFDVYVKKEGFGIK